MSRSRKGKLTLQDILAAPWWVSAWVAAFAFVAFQWLFPAVTSQSLVLKALALGLRPLGYVLALFFGLVALINFFRQSGGRIESARSDEARERAVEPSFSGRIPKSDRVMDAWQASMTRLQDTPAKPTEWSIGLLRLIEWKRFEEVCAGLFERLGFVTRSATCGADGGIDIHLYRPPFDHPVAIVQCKAQTSKVGVKVIRELRGVMTSERVAEGIFATTSTYSDDAIAFAKANQIDLMNGDAVLKAILKLPEEQHASLLRLATAGDYTTPTCASCGVKMIARKPKVGGKAFWGCVNYPKCKMKLYMAAS